MATSPRSTVSSDLYSPSEPALPPAHSMEGSYEAHDHHTLFKGGNRERERSGYSDTAPGSDSADEDISGSPSAATGPTVETSSETKHKRKREEYLESYDDAREHTRQDQDEGRPPVSRNASGLAGGSSHRHGMSNLYDELRVKRSKPNGKTGISIKEMGLWYNGSALPAALWQYIFCFVPPVYLGRLLRVNHAFNSYLMTETETKESASLKTSIIQPTRAETIWVASRRRFAPGLPRPISGMRELEMWRLLVGQNCQRCGLVNNDPTASRSDNPWTAGPGNSGVRVVWPFVIRCCGPCLQDISRKEFDLYLSLSTDCPSFLVPAVPFAFVSDDNHYIGHNLLRNQTAPSTLKMVKRFYNPGVEDLKRKFQDAIALGAASAEEWSKGLTTQGQERLEDTIRWEVWESKGGLNKVNSRHHSRAYPNGASNNIRSTYIKDEMESDRSTPQSMVLSINTSANDVSPDPDSFTDPAHHILPSSSKQLSQPAWNDGTYYPSGTHEGVQTPVFQSRPERNLRDVNQAKALRKAEIERRCAALDPPILPNVLTHMDSFQAAMQITQPMTEQAWQVLRPRLLAQLPYAERKEKERVRQDGLLVEEYRQRRLQEVQLRETKESFDREWETFQNPVRNRLGALADEIIESRWTGGKSVTKDMSPKFAADVLLNVHRRFSAEIARADEAALAAGEPIKTDPPNGPPTRKLILENMKWLFDTKIKPLTDHFQRELFLCNGCDGNSKFYGFEGVIQHYAAKHTTTLSMGNIVVHWRAEWPKHPPFNPNPSVAKTAYYKIPTPVNPAPGPTQEVEGPISHGSQRQYVETGSSAAPQWQGNSQNVVDTYVTANAGYRQESNYQAIAAQPTAPNTLYSGSPGYTRAQNGYASIAGSYNAIPAPYHSQVPQGYTSTNPAHQSHPAFTQAQLGTNTQAYYPGSGNHVYGGGQSLPYQPSLQAGSLPASAAHIPAQVSDLYQRQMDEMAKHAKDVFIGIGGVKDLPGSVRIHVVIQLTVSRFKVTFPNEPSLSMFIDGLDHNATMRPVRSVNGLGCKTCMQSGTGAKLFTLPHLVNHFRTVHVETPQTLGNSQMPELDWKSDMIDLPDASIISKLTNAAGMTDSKLGLIASVFGGYFPKPLPSLRGKMNSGPLPTCGKELDLNSNGPPKVPSKATTDAALSSEYISSDHAHGRPYNGFPLSQGPSSELLEPPGDDEYDPHRPAFLGRIVKVGSGSVQSHRSAKSLVPQYTQRSSSSIQIQPSQQISSGHVGAGQPYDHSTVTRTSFSENHTYGSQDTIEQTIHSYSPRSDLVRVTGGQSGVRGEEQSKPQRLDNFAKYDVPARHVNGYRRPLENGRDSANQKSLRRDSRTASPRGPIDAADKLLSSLAPTAGTGRSTVPYALDHGVASRSEAPWQGEPQRVAHSRGIGEGGALDSWPGRGSIISRHDNEVPAHLARCDPSHPQSSVQFSATHRPESRAQRYDELLPSSCLRFPTASFRADRSPIARYDPHEGSNVDKNDVNGNTLKRPRNGSYTVQAAHLSQYEPVTIPPQASFADTALYRARSPVEEDRGDSVYRARSPSVRRQNVVPKVMSYDYPQQPRYEYFDDRSLQETQYHPRVEYVRVPVDYENARLREPPARYLVSRPVEQLEPEYVRYEQTYASEPIYERDGQVYHASQRAF